MRDRIVWKSDWDTGIPVIDTEHRRLIDLLGRIQEEISSDSEYLRASLLSLASEVTNHLAAHFAHEEAILPEYLSESQVTLHRCSHAEWRQKLLRSLAELKNEMFVDHSTERMKELAELFIDEILNFFEPHFQQHDCLLKSCKFSR